jgi:hypothetical protein
VAASWSPDELRLMNAAGELQVAVKSSDGSTKYGRDGAGPMVTATAAATTLQLNHE